MKRKFGFFTLLVMVVLTCFALTSCKYKGFKKDRSTGLYYRFYDTVHDTAVMPKTGDIACFVMALHTKDSMLIPTMPARWPVDSLYKGDLFDALRMMHVGDSATFILDGRQFYEKMMMMQTQEYPFGKDPLYLDMKLYFIISAEEFEQMKAQYDAMITRLAASEDSLIRDYVKMHKIKPSPAEDGLYYMPSRKGTGAQPQIMDEVKVHYTGRFIDGTVFDSSIDRGEPFIFRLGANEVIPGWEKAVSMMHVGEKANFLLPSILAYGIRGVPGTIPPCTPLLFEIELLDIVEPDSDSLPSK